MCFADSRRSLIWQVLCRRLEALVTRVLLESENDAAALADGANSSSMRYLPGRRRRLRARLTLSATDGFEAAIRLSVLRFSRRADLRKASPSDQMKMCPAPVIARLVRQIR